MRSQFVLRRALLGLFAATLGGVAASVGAVHIRSQLAETAQATTFPCPQQAHAGRPSHTAEAVPSIPHASQGTCAAATSHMNRWHQPPVVAVLVPVQGNKNISAGQMDRDQRSQNSIFADAGSVSYGGVIFCSRNCPSGPGPSQAVTVPVTVVNVYYNGSNKKTATKP